MSDPHSSAVAHHFEDMPQQREAATLGMWAFLATEVLFFGGLFISYLVYRSSNPEMFVAASQKLDVMLGAVNTFILLGSSLTMALAVHAAQEGKRTQTVRFMIFTLLLGLVFLGIKSYEYAHKFEEGLFPGAGFRFEEPFAQSAQIYFSLYFAMTGIHGLHMIIGMVILVIMIVFARRGKYTAEYYQPVELFGLYWHFVDIVWIFLYPLLYLIRVHA
ncbi:MAG: cytochrome c oxidase subunit 3 family protein [Bacteroidota bacterium]